MKEVLDRILNHETLTREETRDILVGITKSEFPMEQITALLTGLQMRGITVDELLGFRDGILETGVPVPLECDRYIDVVGTGGDRKNTFNISTTSCFVIAGAGYKVAKHGNYAATSTSGASNVIANHGVKFTDDTGASVTLSADDAAEATTLDLSAGDFVLYIKAEQKEYLTGEKYFTLKADGYAETTFTMKIVEPTTQEG